MQILLSNSKHYAALILSPVAAPSLKRFFALHVSMTRCRSPTVDPSLFFGMYTSAMGDVFAHVLEKVEWGYVGDRRRLLVGVDNMGVLKKLRKRRGFCGQVEQRVRKVGLRLMEKGWEVVLVWVAGHVVIEENEKVDERAKGGC